MLSFEITLGNIITAGSILFGWGIYVVALRGKVDLLMQALGSIDRRLTAVESSMASQTQAFIQLAKQEVMLQSLDQRVDDLEKLR